MRMRVDRVAADVHQPAAGEIEPPSGGRRRPAAASTMWILTSRTSPSSPNVPSSSSRASGWTGSGSPPSPSRRPCPRRRGPRGPRRRCSSDGFSVSTCLPAGQPRGSTAVQGVRRAGLDRPRPPGRASRRRSRRLRSTLWRPDDARRATGHGAARATSGRRSPARTDQRELGDPRAPSTPIRRDDPMRRDPAQRPAFAKSPRRYSTLARTSVTGPSPDGSPGRIVSCSRTYHPS